MLKKEVGIATGPIVSPSPSIVARTGPCLEYAPTAGSHSSSPPVGKIICKPVAVPPLPVSPGTLHDRTCAPLNHEVNLTDAENSHNSEKSPPGTNDNGNTSTFREHPVTYNRWTVDTSVGTPHSRRAFALTVPGPRSHSKGHCNPHSYPLTAPSPANSTGPVGHHSYLVVLFRHVTNHGPELTSDILGNAVGSGRPDIPIGSLTPDLTHGCNVNAPVVALLPYVVHTAAVSRHVTANKRNKPATTSPVTTTVGTRGIVAHILYYHTTDAIPGTRRVSPGTSSPEKGPTKIGRPKNPPN